MIKDIISVGIDLELKNKIQELDFLVKMHRFINDRSKIRSYIEESRIIIESMWFDPLLSVEVEHGVMSVIPITDEGFFDALIEIIHFMYFLDEKEKPPPKQKPDPNEFEWI